MRVSTRKLRFRNGSTYLVRTHSVARRHHLRRRFQRTRGVRTVNHLTKNVTRSFGGLIVIIRNCDRVLRKHFTTSSPAHRLLSRVRHTNRQTNSLAQRLLTFDHRRILIPRILGLGRIITSARGVLHHLVKRSIVLRICLDPSLNPVQTSPNRVRRILVGLTMGTHSTVPRNN